jgi:hypothetical protein
LSVIKKILDGHVRNALGIFVLYAIILNTFIYVVLMDINLSGSQLKKFVLYVNNRKNVSLVDHVQLLFVLSVQTMILYGKNVRMVMKQNLSIKIIAQNVVLKCQV